MCLYNDHLQWMEQRGFGLEGTNANLQPLTWNFYNKISQTSISKVYASVGHAIVVCVTL